MKSTKNHLLSQLAFLFVFQQAQSGVASKPLPRQITVRPARKDATLSGGPQMTASGLPDGLSALLARHTDGLLGLHGLRSHSRCAIHMWLMCTGLDPQIGMHVGAPVRVRGHSRHGGSEKNESVSKFVVAAMKGRDAPRPALE